MRRELTHVNGYFEVTIPAYLSREFENHFRMTSKTCQLLTQEIKHTGRNLTGNSSGRPAILPGKQMLLFLWSVANSPTLGRETKLDISCEWNTQFSIISEIPSNRVHSKRGRFPFDQKFRDFRFEIEWNGKNSGKSFRKFRNTF